jgi:hypothetical protein
MVASCRFGRCSPCFEGNDVVCCRSRLVVSQKYEAYNDACSDPVAHGLHGHFQVRTTAVRVRVRVGPPTALNRY